MIAVIIAAAYVVGALATAYAIRDDLRDAGGPVSIVLLWPVAAVGVVLLLAEYVLREAARRRSQRKAVRRE